MLRNDELNHTDLIIREIVERISRFPSVNRVILFGSRARGDCAERADIDLAVDAPGATQREWVDIEEAVEDAPTFLICDVIRFHEVSDFFKEQIIYEGKLLFEYK
jgi:predicted nucleotidyltransferase